MKSTRTFDCDRELKGWSGATIMRITEPERLAANGDKIPAVTVPTTHGFIAFNSVASDLPSDVKSLSAEESTAKFILATRLYAGGIVELTMAEVAKIQERISEAYGKAEVQAIAVLIALNNDPVN